MEKNYNKIISTIIFVTLIIVILNSQNKYDKKLEKINKSKFSSVGYSTRIKSYKNGRDLYFYFFVNNKKITSKISLKEHNKNLINKFFLVKFEENNPENNHLYINKELELDSISLVKAGFKYVPYYEHNFSTNTYIKKLKWQ